MKTSHKMNPGMQSFGIGRMLANTRWNNEMFDIHANLDRTLTYGENAANIRSKLGISTRNRGIEAIRQRADERHREQVRRKDTTRQTGIIQTAFCRRIDAMFQAMKPGKRTSRTGHVYYERRENRSDVGENL